MPPGVTRHRVPKNIEVDLGSEGGGDIDVLAENGSVATVRGFLQGQGFHSVLKPHPYWERYRRWIPGVMQARTVDLFKTLEWVLGIVRPKPGVTPRRACGFPAARPARQLSKIFLGARFRFASPSQRVAQPRIAKSDDQKGVNSE